MIQFYLARGKVQSKEVYHNLSNHIYAYTLKVLIKL